MPADPVPASFLRVAALEAEDVGSHGDLLSRTHSGDLDLILVRNVYPADFLAARVARIARKELDFPALPIPPSKAAVVLGHPLDLANPPLEDYFEDARQTSECLRTLFADGVDFEERIRGILSALSGGRAARVMEHGDGRTYSPSTVRYLGPGAHIRMHCEDQKLGEPAKRRIHEVAQPHVSSFYMMMLPPRSGGELALYDLTWDQVEESLLEAGRVSPEKVHGRFRAEAYTLDAGDLVLFGNGRIHEVRPVGPDTSRWSIGGFFTFSQDDRTVYYFS